MIAKNAGHQKQSHSISSLKSPQSILNTLYITYLYFLDDENQLPDGCFAIKLSEETQERMEVVANWHLNELEPQIEIPLELLNKDLAEYKDQSDFHFLTELITKCKLLAPLLIFDPTEQCGEQYLICLSGEAKYGLYMPTI